MVDSSPGGSSPGMSRRGFLKLGLVGGGLLAMAGVTTTVIHWPGTTPAPDFHVLRPGDLSFLEALIPVVLAGALPSDDDTTGTNETLKGLDHMLWYYSPGNRKELLQLFDLVTLPVTRGPLTGVWGGWERASSEDVQVFLGRWETSSIATLRMAHHALLQIIPMAWYSRPVAWSHAGYPGPPTL